MADMVSPPRSRLVGVLGGMGPRATVDFYDKLVTLSDARTDQEHVRVVMWADPTVPSRQDALLGDGDDPSPWLRQGVHALLVAGAELIVVPCNTAHHWLARVMPDDVEWLDIVEVTLAALAVRDRPSGPAGPAGASGGSGARDAEDVGGAVGLLATDALLVSGLYQRGLERAGRRVVLPDEAGQQALTELVGAVKRGVAPRRLLAGLEVVVEPLRAAGATSVVAACTELSSILDQTTDLAGCTLVDPSRELALATISRASAPAVARAS